ncbi:ArnT family glycosyltransferase [Tundrisphaera sp. TA3]|uniref:ArnT family glycosyltransferase n=1 Tax=Tundrisphaera sp. TA3 TaxID=3435775 RepID=UPI003EBD070D
MMTPRRTLWLLIGASTLLRLAWASILGPGNDEAYHYLFWAHPDWSYFDHPPMVAVIESIGPALLRGSTSPFALRLGFIALFAGSTWLMYRLAERPFGPRVGLLAAFALNVTAYHTAAASSFVLPDGPLLFFWLLTLDRLAAAFDEPDRIFPWLGVGVAWGLALLSKYHAIFLPAGALIYLWVEPSARRVLRRPGPYLAALIGILVFSPVIAWNASHHWVSFLFQGGRAVGSLWPRPDYLAAMIGGQIAYLFPWIWIMLAVIMVRGVRQFRKIGRVERFFLCGSIAPLVAFTGVACFHRVLPHWTLVGYLSLFPLLGLAWEARWRADPAKALKYFKMLALATLIPVAFVLAEYQFGFLQQGARVSLGILPPKSKIDQTIELYGWDQVAEELGRRGLLGRDTDFLFTGNWISSGQIAYATRDSGIPVLCYNDRDARGFAFWSRPEDWVGKDGLLISVNDRQAEPECYERYFSRIEPVAAFDVTRAGGVVRSIRVFRCIRQIMAFPFLPGDLDAEPRRVVAIPAGDEARARSGLPRSR